MPGKTTMSDRPRIGSTPGNERLEMRDGPAEGSAWLEIVMNSVSVAGAGGLEPGAGGGFTVGQDRDQAWL